MSTHTILRHGAVHLGGGIIRYRFACSCGDLFQGTTKALALKAFDHPSHTGFDPAGLLPDPVPETPWKDAS